MTLMKVACYCDGVLQGYMRRGKVVKEKRGGTLYNSPSAAAVCIAAAERRNSRRLTFKAEKWRSTQVVPVTPLLL